MKPQQQHQKKTKKKKTKKKKKKRFINSGLFIRILTANTISLFRFTKTCLYNVDPLKPHFYIVKMGFTGVYIIFLIFAQNMDCGYSLEPPHRGGSNEYLQSMF